MSNPRGSTDEKYIELLGCDVAVCMSDFEPERLGSTPSAPAILLGISVVETRLSLKQELEVRVPSFPATFTRAPLT